MSIMTKPSAAFATALTYITVGTLIGIWTIVAFRYYPPETDRGHFLLIGSMASGIALLVIGLLVGVIGRAARHAELPPAEVAHAVEQANVQAAAHPPVVVAGSTAAPVATTIQPDQAQRTPAAPVVPSTPVVRGN
jgi:hypothetical protein